jgi:hypothetical protein
MVDRSDEVRALMQAELDKNNDPASLRITHHPDGNEDGYKAYVHRPGEDRFAEFDIFTNFDEPIEIPPYHSWWA